MNAHCATTVRDKDDVAPLWAVALLGLGPAIALGWARFGYALLLPAMQHALGWNYAQAGALNTANALGYLLGALLASTFARRFGLRRTFHWSIVSIIAALFGCALTSSFGPLLMFRALAGIGGAVTFISGAVLVAAGAGTQRRASTSLAMYFAGAGLGITVAALTIPLLLTTQGGNGWAWGWAALAGLSLSALALVQPALGYFHEITERGGDRFTVSSLSRLIPIAIGYGLFGMGYSGYMTFIVAFLHRQGIANAGVATVWAMLGGAAIVASFVWGNVFHRLRGGKGLATVLMVVTAGVLLPLIGTGIGTAVASALLVGGSVLAAPSAVTHFAHKVIAPRHWTSTISALTVCFGVGQTVGPVLIGAVSDAEGGIAAGLVVSAGILLAGVVAALVQSEKSEQTHNTITSTAVE